MNCNKIITKLHGLITKQFIFLSATKAKPNFILITCLSLALLIVSIAALSIIVNNKIPKQVLAQPQQMPQEDFVSDLPPKNFMPAIAKEEVTTPNAEYAPLKAEEVFTPVTPEIDPATAKQQEEIKRFLKKRNNATRSNAGGFVVKYTEQNGANYSIENIDQYRNMDKDYSIQQIPTSLTSRPVDLSRTLPMTEIIPVILIDEIKSELAGEVVRAAIPQNVYAYHGRKILIPAGSTAIGRYKPLQKIGDTRLAIAFYRIVTPEGINIKLNGFASDQEGSEGLTGELDNKTKEKFGGAGIASLIQAMAQLSINVDNQQQKAAAGAVTQPLSEVITQVISQSINIAPTLRIPKGSTFNIKFASDIWFPEPVASVIETIAL